MTEWQNERMNDNVAVYFEDDDWDDSLYFTLSKNPCKPPHEVIVCESFQKTNFIVYC